MVESVFIIGATGKVGKELVHQIYDKGDTNTKMHKNPTRVVGLASSTSVLYRPEGISEKEAKDFSKRSVSGEKYEGVLDLFKFIKSSAANLSVVDVTSCKEDMLELHKKIIKETKHKIVTANKNPLTLSNFESFQQLIGEPRRYGYRCSVMAGAEAVDKIMDMRDLGEMPTEIMGSFSGTLGYIASEIESGKKFSDVLKDAIKMGYTEPNPVVDLSGEDVAKKMLILVRTAGFNINISDIKLSSFVPKEYFMGERLDASAESVKNLDTFLSEKMEDAKKKGGTLRYVARFKFNGSKPEMSVGLEFVSLKEPLGKLQGAANKIVVKARIYGEKYYTVEAPGAGISITAMNVRRDLLHQIESRQVAST